MKNFFDEMIDAIDIEKTGEDTTLGQSIDMGWGRLFGGQLLAQSLATGQKFTDMGDLHSLHAHFLEMGDVNVPVKYRVIPVRKGRSYQSIRVEAYQHSRIIFHSFQSFQREEAGVSHFQEMPEVPQPDELMSYQERLKQMVAMNEDGYRKRFSPLWHQRLGQSPPIEVRPIKPLNFMFPETRDPDRLLWFRASQRLDDDPCLHQRVVTWASDFPMLGTALQPSNIPPPAHKIKMASLDHTIWFYAPFRADEWLLCHINSPRSGQGRGLSFSEIYRQDGVLVACCSQEGMLRQRLSRV